MTITPAGKRDRYLTLWRNTSDAGTPDSAGQVSATWLNLGTVWGMISDVQGQQLNASGVPGQIEYYLFYHMQVEARFVAVIPYVENFTAIDKITEEWKGRVRTYQVAGPPYDTNEELIIPLNENAQLGGA